MSKTKPNNNSIDLTKAYQVAEEQIIASLKGTNINNIKAKFTKTLQTVFIKLEMANTKSLTQEVKSGQLQSQRKFISNLSSIFNGRAFTVRDLQNAGLNIKNQKVAAEILERKTKDLEKSSVYRKNYLELSGKLVGVSNSLQQEVNKTLHNLANKNTNTVNAAINELTARLKENGCFSVKYNNGANIGVNKYANMVCRSARTESANAENVRISKEFGTDLVECIGNAVTCSVCANFRGRVFSISGKDKRYPPLRDGVNSPLKNGYDLIHPNCRCEFRAFFEEFHSDDENKEKQKFSNREYDGDKRTLGQAKAYQDWQNVMRRANDEQYRYNEMKSVLGDNMQYANVASLRRAMRSDKDSFAYKKSHYAVRDYKQFERWQTLFGKENLPNTLADFQQLKYNDSRQFSLLVDYKHSIEKGRLSPLIDYKKYINTKAIIDREIIGTTTSNGIKIKSQSKHFIERVFGSVEQRRSGVSIENIKKCLIEGKATSIKTNVDGKRSLSLYIVGVKISINPDNGALIQVNPYNRR